MPNEPLNRISRDELLRLLLDLDNPYARGHVARPRPEDNPLHPYGKELDEANNYSFKALLENGWPGGTATVADLYSRSVAHKEQLPETKGGLQLIPLYLPALTVSRFFADMKSEIWQPVDAGNEFSAGQIIAVKEDYDFLDEDCTFVLYKADWQFKEHDWLDGREMNIKHSGLFLRIIKVEQVRLQDLAADPFAVRGLGYRFEPYHITKALAKEWARKLQPILVEEWREVWGLTHFTWDTNPLCWRLSVDIDRTGNRRGAWSDWRDYERRRRSW